MTRKSQSKIEITLSEDQVKFQEKLDTLVYTVPYTFRWDKKNLFRSQSLCFHFRWNTLETSKHDGNNSAGNWRVRWLKPDKRPTIYSPQFCFGRVGYFTLLLCVSALLSFSPLRAFHKGTNLSGDFRFRTCSSFVRDIYDDLASSALQFRYLARKRIGWISPDTYNSQRQCAHKYRKSFERTHLISNARETTPERAVAFIRGKPINTFAKDSLSACWRKKSKWIPDGQRLWNWIARRLFLPLVSLFRYLTFEIASEWGLRWIAGETGGGWVHSELKLWVRRLWILISTIPE